MRRVNADVSNPIPRRPPCGLHDNRKDKNLIETAYPAVAVFSMNRLPPNAPPVGGTAERAQKTTGKGTAA